MINYLLNFRKAGVILPNIILYSSHCPRCKVLEDKLAKKNVSYTLFDDVQKMIELGITSVPIFEADGVKMEFRDANKWINEYEGE